MNENAFAGDRCYRILRLLYETSVRVNSHQGTFFMDFTCCLSTEIKSRIQNSHTGTDNWQFTLTEQCETQEHLKEREDFGNTGLKCFSLLMERKNVYIKSSFLAFL